VTAVPRVRARVRTRKLGAVDGDDLVDDARDTGIPPRAAASQKSVLIVDDDEALARVLGKVLAAAGYEVSTAHDGTVAVEQIVRRTFDVIVSDIELPGMTGIDLLRVVRAYDLDVPLILMTGAPTVATAVEAVALGALQYLQKPFPNDVLLKAVEQASRLHRMAEIKRDALQVLGEVNNQAGDRAGLEVRLKRALDTMWMAFQPIVDTVSRRVFGYEALMRTLEPSFPNPGAVLSAAERLNRLGDVGRRVRTLSAGAFANAPPDTLLFVNLHTQDLLDPTLYEASAPLSKIAGRVVLEVTERTALEGVKDLQARVSILRYNGFRVAIDDLGAGYAGLASFASLEPEVVKLDMSLVRNVHQSAVRQRIVGSMVSLCKDMGMRVVVEGVQVAGELATLSSLGCDLMQGYFFAKPGPPFPVAKGFA
jgi:EAL domain-containing protein (putative c-di-GMP-specific phosphodiesterase class I)/CheY-like chemotaxis protein